MIMGGIQGNQNNDPRAESIHGRRDRGGASAAEQLLT